MPMLPFIERFPDLGARETRSITVGGRQDLPDGEYGFVEFYCAEPECDCRRLIVNVLRAETGWSKVWATISYGWDTLEFYREWGAPGSDPIEMKGPYLDPLNPQTKYSDAILVLFRLLLQSPDYVERIKRHYQMFRDSVDLEYANQNAQKTKRPENRRKLKRGPKRRRH